LSLIEWDRMSTTRPLAIVITIAAIITAATTITSLSAATPAFAKRNCNADQTVCTGGSGCGTAGCQGGRSFDHNNNVQIFNEMRMLWNAAKRYAG
jgi:hypothetical protein